MDVIEEGIRRTTFPLPFGLDHVHCYFLRTRAGLDARRHRASASREPEERWRPVLDELDAPLERIVVTHMHPDHVGGAARRRRSDGAPVLQGREDYEQCVSAWGDHDPQRFVDYWVSHGMPPRRRRRHRARVGAPRRAVHWVRDPQLLDAGDEIDGWRVELLPGHADGHIVLLRDGVMIAGDTILGGITPTIGLYPIHGPTRSATTSRRWRASRRSPRALHTRGTRSRSRPGGARARDPRRTTASASTAPRRRSTRPPSAYDVSLELFERDLLPGAPPVRDRRVARAPRAPRARGCAQRIDRAQGVTPPRNGDPWRWAGERPATQPDQDACVTSPRVLLAAGSMAATLAGIVPVLDHGGQPPRRRCRRRRRDLDQGRRRDHRRRRPGRPVGPPRAALGSRAYGTQVRLTIVRAADGATLSAGSLPRSTAAGRGGDEARRPRRSARGNHGPRSRRRAQLVIARTDVPRDCCPGRGDGTCPRVDPSTWLEEPLSWGQSLGHGSSAVGSARERLRRSAIKAWVVAALVSGVRSTRARCRNGPRSARGDESGRLGPRRRRRQRCSACCRDCPHTLRCRGSGAGCWRELCRATTARCGAPPPVSRSPPSTPAPSAGATGDQSASARAAARRPRALRRGRRRPDPG